MNVKKVWALFVALAICAVVFLIVNENSFQYKEKEIFPEGIDVMEQITKVSMSYGEANPRLEKLILTSDVSTKAPMFIVRIRGNFHRTDQQATFLMFSMLASGKQVWAITGLSSENQVVWED
ncbi:hypothetical protein [Heliophilum fasciatum]|uniref:Uncharacterized protein n=1 Tax=Heliophilum fasciatum TaxID=35700 RepID=A0A4R2RZP8_9FIRM|nr:hypothetical protein [Heliophilum fasciatum]MCW2276931.1 hypothetical protein [Heliophilum fasciatum]TCP68609.1 hypothetical protein EDD73_1024 [Heliophilum fasciatum]